MKRIKIAEFRARDIKENPMTAIEVEKYRGYYYFIAFNGNRSTRYTSIAEAKEDIKGSYGEWHDFKLLV